MFIVPMSPAITPLQGITELTQTSQPSESQKAENGAAQPTFLDVFNNIITEAVDANQQKADDIVGLIAGDTNNLEAIQANIAKAEVATELLVTVKNTALDAYNEIIKMSI